jgi:lipid-binding SYLF domain-containing protein
MHGRLECVCPGTYSFRPVSSSSGSGARSGGVLRPDNDASRHFYGHSVASRELLSGKTEHMPSAAHPFIAALNAPKHGV